jgi:RNA polymerase sigma factor (sigma-70 family)
MSIDHAHECANQNLSNEMAGIVQDARAGEQDAWNRIVERCTPLLWAVARRYGLSTQDAADAVQVTWLRCLERIAQLRNPGALPAWLVAICRHESLQVRQARARLVPLDDGEVAEYLAGATDCCPMVDPLGEALRRERVAAVREAVSDLPGRQRALVAELLRIDGGRSDGVYAEITRTLEMPEGSIGPTRQRAFARLRRHPALQCASTEATTR